MNPPNSQAIPTLSLTFLLIVHLLATCFVDANAAEREVKQNVLAGEVLDLFEQKCAKCHSADNPLGGVSITDQRHLVHDAKVVVSGKPEDSPLLQRLLAADASRMPPPGEAALTASEKDIVRRWIKQGAVSFQNGAADREETTAGEQTPITSERTGDEYVLAAILRHVKGTDESTRPFFRYFSLHHLRDADPEVLQTHRDALAVAVNHLSWGEQLVSPTPIDAPHNTVLALDIRKTGWSAEALRPVKGDSSSSRPANLYDLVLLEYPYGVWREDSPTLQRLSREYLLPADLIRPIPYVRADWFIANGTRSPLYEDLLRLPRDVAGLETMLNVDRRDNLRRGVAVRAGLTVSGVSRNMRIVERHPRPGGYYWVSLDFSGNTSEQNFFLDLLNPKPAGGEMIFNLPNGLQAYFIADGKGRRLSEAPTSIVADHFADDAIVRNGLSCIRCHRRGVNPFEGVVRRVVSQLPGSAGVDTVRVRQLYPGPASMRRLVDGDVEQFQGALQRLLGHTRGAEAVALAVERFERRPLKLATVASELGFSNAQGLDFAFRTRRLLALGLAPLAGGSTVRRDTWEEITGDVVAELGLGIPLPPLDRLTVEEVSSSSSIQSPTVRLSTNQESNLFSAGDLLSIAVTNETDRDQFIELVGVSNKGEMVVLKPGGVRVAAGETIRIPESGGIVMGESPGRERILLYSAPARFAPGEIRRGVGVPDRFVHRFFRTLPSGDAPDTTKVLRRELVVETR